jgi:DNA-directed RNA polymerase subunit beta
VLIKELQSLGLDVKVMDKNDEEIDMKQNFENDEISLTPVDDRAFTDFNDAETADGFGVEGGDAEADEEDLIGEDSDYGDALDEDEEEEPVFDEPEDES